MSTFGGPGGGQKISKPTPPERGSFPLDHDGECKSVMAAYLRCLRSHRGSNDPECRELSKSYLSCRMERNLMAPDSFKNLGFGDEQASIDAPSASSSATPLALQATTATPSQQQPQPQTRDEPRGS